MAQITLSGICKSFRVTERPKGRLGLLRGAFTREHRTVEALRDVCFSIDEGELVGYIGPNGAGKSTTVKVMSGILTPDAGECIVMGVVPWRQRVKHVAGIGVVFGQRSQLWWDVPVRDSFDLLRDMYAIGRADYAQRLCELADTLEFGDLLSTPVRQLSLGQRMRCEVAAALLHRPRILFLDEPTIGLDAVSKLKLREFLQKENRESGVTMILTTHDMDDVEALCHRVMVIGRGRLLYDGAMGELRRKYAPLRCVRAKTPGRRVLPQIDGAQSCEADEGRASVWFDPAIIPAHEVVARVAAQTGAADVTITEQDVDEMIARMYREMAI